MENYLFPSKLILFMPSLLYLVTLYMYILVLLLFDMCISVEQVEIVRNYAEYDPNYNVSLSGNSRYYLTGGK